MIQKLFFLLLFNPTETVHDWWKPWRPPTVPNLRVCLWGTGQQMPVTGWAITKQPGRWFDISEWFGTKVQNLGRHLSPDTSRKKNTSLKGTAGLAFLDQPSGSSSLLWGCYGLIWLDLWREDLSQFLDFALKHLTYLEPAIQYQTLALSLSHIWS